MFGGPAKSTLRILAIAIILLLVMNFIALISILRTLGAGSVSGHHALSGLLPSLLLFAMVAYLFGNSKLAFNSRSLKPNNRWFFVMNGRPEREWQDIQRISLSSTASEPAFDNIGWKRRKTDKFKVGGYSSIHIFFKSGGYFTIYLDGMAEDDGHQLLQAIGKWAPQDALTHQMKELCKSVREPHPLTLAWNDQMLQATGYMTLSPGKYLQDRLKIERELASSGFSAVYLAQDGDKPVIVKEISLAAIKDEVTKAKTRELFHREAQLLAQIRHSRIPRVLDHFTQGDREYIELELMEGNSLRALVTRPAAKPLDEKTILQIALQLAQIVEFLHGLEQPIIHRDITPDNVILKADGTVALIDFGAANVFVEAATGTMIGKQAYIPPEQLRGKAVLASDIYALGATIYFLLTTKDPLPLSCSSPLEADCKVSLKLDALIERSTAMEADSRPQAVQLVQELKEML